MNEFVRKKQMKNVYLFSGYSSSSNAEVKNEWSYTTTPPILLHDVVLNIAMTGLHGTVFS
jgi:hypothetical protein